MDGKRASGGMMAAVGTILFTAALAPMVQAEQPLQIRMDANSVVVRAGDVPLARYRYSNVPFKPYVKELFTPSGLNLLLDAPSDHLHHHALMFAVAVDGTNFWEETPTAGKQAHGGFAEVLIAEHGGWPSAGFTERVHWIPSVGQGALTEQRIIDICQAGDLGATLLTWRSELRVPKGKQSVTLSGSHYFGLGMRFVRSMDGGEFFNAAGKEGTIFRGEERLVQANWCAYTATPGGKPVTVAMFGHPDNPRQPTIWFMMAQPFAYLSGTMGLHTEPLTIAADKPLVLRYAVAAWDGPVEKDRIDQAYQRVLRDYWAVGRLKTARREAQQRTP
jgi:hypothetical protein